MKALCPMVKAPDVCNHIYWTKRPVVANIEDICVPKLETFKIEGLSLKFNSLDHMEPHFHVLELGGKWEIRVYFLTCTEDFMHIEYKRPPNPPATFAGISRSKRKELLNQILKNRARLLHEWERKVKVVEKYNAST